MLRNPTNALSGTITATGTIVENDRGIFLPFVIRSGCDVEEREPNNVAEDAQRIDQVCLAKGSITGTLPQDDGDIYRIDNGGTALSLRFTLTVPAGHDFAFYIYDGTYTYITGAQSGGCGVDETLDITLQANETYYIFVYRHPSCDANAEAGYTFSWQKQQ